MPAARFPKRPKLTQRARNDIDASLCPKIDACLKAARQCAQQVAPFESCLQDEMRILERLYYKGANQHRSALFWRRVKEVRRLGRRVLEVRLSGLLDDLRYSFYVGEDVERNPKILKSAWSKVPDARFLTFINDRLRDILELICTTKERLMKAYHSLLLMMQTGAFLQLIVILTAIVSRLNAVMEELGTILQPFLSNFEDLLEALEYKRNKKMTRIADRTQMPKATSKSTHPVNRAVSDSEQVDSNGEDLGSTVLRKHTGRSSETNIDTREASIESFWPQQQRQQQDNDNVVIDEDSTPVSIPEPPSIIIKAGVDARFGASQPATPGQAEPGVTSSKETTKVRKKKKKRKDEIDEIFGLL
ncbi:hypothetical protein ACEPAF_5075 [Sanghuangporus sanghuang]